MAGDAGEVAGEDGAFVALLRRQRRAAGLTQEELAARGAERARHR